jgi:hypothetical protein
MTQTDMPLSGAKMRSLPDALGSSSNFTQSRESLAQR